MDTNHALYFRKGELLHDNQNRVGLLLQRHQHHQKSGHANRPAAVSADCLPHGNL